MKMMKTEEAVGHILCHDITQIIRGVTKAPVFRKGHIITKEDIPVLLSVGKDHVYIWENDDTVYHENEGAAILRDICMGANMHGSEPKEGKIELIADCDGMLTVHRQGLEAVNSLGEMMIATRHGGFTVRKGDKLAGTRVIPLIIKKEKMAKAKTVQVPCRCSTSTLFIRSGPASSRRVMKFFMAVLKILLRRSLKVSWLNLMRKWLCTKCWPMTRQPLRPRFGRCSTRHGYGFLYGRHERRSR